MPGFSQGLWDSLIQGAPFIAPQIFLCVIATLMLWPGDLFLAKGEKGKWALLTFLVLAITGVFVAWRVPMGEAFNGMYRVDGLTKGFQVIVILSSLAAVALSQRVLDALQ